MCNNVINLFLLFPLLLLTKSGGTFRFFSSDTGTYKEARPFFIPSNNIVHDYFDGNLANVFQTINSHTFVFVMYYAHFCGISRRMREPFEKAANFYRERIHHGNVTMDRFHVKFIAVDCFYHAGACRKTYKLEYYPHMLLYIKGTHGYQYFGPPITSSLIDFVEKIRMPVSRLTNLDEFLDFNVQYESNVLAQFDFSDNLNRQQYSLFAQAALKHIEYDNEHPIRYAVILNQSIVSELSKLTNRRLQKPFIVLNQLNSPLQVFPNLTNNFTMENLYRWTLKKFIKPHVSWIVPRNRYYSRSPSIDRATIFDSLTHYDNVLIFLTSNKLDELKLRQIYLYLSDCNITHASLWLKQIQQLYKHSVAKLGNNFTKTQYNILSSCCQYVLNKMTVNDIYNLCLLKQELPPLNLSDTKIQVCRGVLEDVQLKQICYHDYCREWLKTYTSMYQKQLNYHHNPILMKRRDKLFEQFAEQKDNIFNDHNDFQEKFQSLLCRTNSTWAFRLIDSKYYPNFGRNIGILNQSRVIIILQGKNEQHYVLNNREITTENIYSLIYNVSHNLQARSLATIPMHYVETEHSNRFIELTTETFHSIVFDTSKHVLVVYYTKWCGFCQSLWPILYETKNFLSKFIDLLFTRIQADKHDLPWHLTVYSYPAIILFPAENKDHSIAFPMAEQSISTVNIIKFLLYHLYIDDNINEKWCRQTNNSFLSMLSSTYIDFPRLSYLVKSFS